jgi:leucyl/phenylalanyl-tRNA--protein transferase
MIHFLESGQNFPDPRKTDKYDTLAYSFLDELTPERMIEAYPQGIFPYYAYKDILVRWCAPKKRYVIFPDEIHVSHSMRNLMNRNRYRCTIDTNFEEVIWSCAKVDGRIYEEGAWLGPDLIKVWIELHERGYAKSVEVWNHDNELVGGLYGFAHGGCFMGDSMFSKEKNASKLALIHLARHMSAEGGTFIDCQYQTSHLDTMGGREISYDKYLELTEDPKPINW